MKLSREHFAAEAKHRVPHLTPEEREAWIDQAHAEHPGFTESGLTGGLADTAKAHEAWMSRAMAAEKELRIWRMTVRLVLASLIIILLILATAKILHAQDNAAPAPPPPDLPLPLEPSDRERLKDLWVEGFLAFAKVEDATVTVERYSRQAADAKVDVQKRQKELDEVNNKIAVMIAAFREKYKAHMDHWCLTRQLGWIPKPGDKPCPAIFADDTPPPSR